MRSDKVLYFVIVLIALSHCLSGCVYSPWRKESYVNKINIPHVAGKLPGKEGFESFFVSGAFVEAHISGTDSTSNSGSAPYRLSVYVSGYKNKHKLIKIHDITVLSNKQNKFEVPSALLREKNFEFSIYGKRFPNFVTAIIRSGYDYDFDIEKDKDITVVVDISVVNVDGEIERAKVKHEFESKLEKGRFLMLTH